MNLTLDTYIISDTHFKHDNIIRYCNRPENHDEIMEINWWRNISIDDDVLHLGDLMWYKSDTSWKDGQTLESAMKRLPGNKYLIKGNHDSRSNIFYENLGFTIAPRRIFFKYGQKTILLTHYPEDRFDIYWHINIHGHTHNHTDKIKEYNGRKYMNVSVEHMNYAPVKLGDILREVCYS